jgi:cyclohexadieny/prephenate dehydrogenase
MFKKITIIGCGLIGSSLLRDIKHKKLADAVTVCDQSQETINFLKKSDLCDEAGSDIKKMIKDASLVIISVPLSAFKEVLLQIKDLVNSETIITDTGSVKKELKKIIYNLNSSNINWISSHPIAGTEKSGVQNGKIDLFKNRWCLISPDEKSKNEDIKLLSDFWTKLGSKVKTVSAEDHDKILSLTSHLPHAIAYSIVSATTNNPEMSKEVIQYSAGGLRDFTRIAASDPLMWKDIFLDNSENLLKDLEQFSKELEHLKLLIKEKQASKLLNLFNATKKVREQIVEAGQDTDKPGFGRK